ncbi:hypothetical protein NBRC116601_14900 [Cognatishimia sp. WU-CL00825]|uniref:glycosyltransferase family 2 protein n=1 Tax=Cognatishimia sp. WU-CL00825 TaxID=3127658 RepID=UPI0031054438
MPQFTIIIPCHNAVETIETTLNAVRAQSVTEWEAICVDDGSTDATARILDQAALADDRFRVLRIANRGPSVARNLGAALAKGEVLCYCDADDYWEATKLAQLQCAFADPDVDGVFAKVAFFASAGQAKTYSSVPKSALTLPMLMGENPVCCMSNLSIRRGLFTSLGGLSDGFVHNEDLEWLLRLVGNGANIVGLDSLQVWYRTSRGGLSADLSKMAMSRKKALQVAMGFGCPPTRENEAVYLRYLARRALRLDNGGATALRFVLRGIGLAPRAFLMPPRRGAATALAALFAPILPLPMRRALFAR